MTVHMCVMCSSPNLSLYEDFCSEECWELFYQNIDPAQGENDDPYTQAMREDGYGR